MKAPHPIFLPLGQRHQEVLLLLLGAPLEQRHGAQAHVHRHGDPQVGVDGLQFLAGQPQADVIHALAAIADREGQTQDPELAHAPQHPLDRLLAAVSVLDHRRDFLPREVPHGLAVELLFFGEGEVHARIIS